MGSLSKAIGAAVGGAVVGTAGTPLLPEGTPWYGYVILYGISIIVPAVVTYLSPANKG